MAKNKRASGTSRDGGKTAGPASFDIQAAKLPGPVSENALRSGGYPYDRKLKRKPYDEELRQLQIELLKAQDWIRKSKERVIVIFEGRDSAGKGGTIKRVTEHLNPRSVKVVALTKPSEQEQGQ